MGLHFFSVKVTFITHQCTTKAMADIVYVESYIWRGILI